MGPWDTFTEFFRSIGEGLGLIKQRDAELNAPDVQKGKVAQTDQEMDDEVINEVNRGDLDAVRKDAAASDPGPVTPPPK